jgi:FkbM family methyltransferase
LPDYCRCPNVIGTYGQKTQEVCKKMRITLRKIIKAFIPYGILKIRKEMISDKVERRKKYIGYKPIGYGEAMEPFVNYIKTNTKLSVKNIFEIGANFAQDADYLMECFTLSAKDVYVFEAHPEIYSVIKKIHQFNAFNNAVFNKEGDIKFNIVPLDSENSGMSSVFKLDNTIVSKEVTVKSIRMDNFMNKNEIKRVDFLKLDVEGATYEVLEGFGGRITDIQAMHIEAEHSETGSFQMTKYFKDIEKLLQKNGFEMVYFQRNLMQSDSFWVRPEILLYK